MLTILMLLAFALPILGFYRDHANNDIGGLRIVLVVMHKFVFKFGNLSTNFLIRVFMSALCWNYVSEWDAQISEIPAPSEPRVCIQPVALFPLGSPHAHVNREPGAKATQLVDRAVQTDIAGVQASLKSDIDTQPL